MQIGNYLNGAAAAIVASAASATNTIIATDTVDDEDDGDIVSDSEQLFHNSVREHFICAFLLIILYFVASSVLQRFRRRDSEDLYSTRHDEIVVYSISLRLCIFSLAIAIGAALLLPISIASNEILLLNPKSYYVKWLNSSLIDALWNYIFLFSNLSLFTCLPLAFLLTESSGFTGYKNRITARIHEALIVFFQLCIMVFGLIFISISYFYPDNNIAYYLPFLYSCVSFLGVLLLLVFTPLGFIHLFKIADQILVKPHLLRDIDEEYQIFHLELSAIERKLENINIRITPINDSDSKHNNNNNNIDNILVAPSINDVELPVTDATTSLIPTQTSETVINRKSKLSPLLKRQLSDEKRALLLDRLNELNMKRTELDKSLNSSKFQRNIIYPVTMLILLFITSVTVLLVFKNMLELLIGIKALPFTSRQLTTLGIMSLSKLGPIGASLEICIILYLGATSFVGLYKMTCMKRIRPKFKKTSIPHIIINCTLVLILSSALPLLSRILGITNFDLLGDYGSIEWLGNFQIVFFYNLIFAASTTFCLVKKITKTVWPIM